MILKFGLAAVLFIDISGFTALNERMAQLGRAGPELVCFNFLIFFLIFFLKHPALWLSSLSHPPLLSQVSRLLNGYFDKLLSAVSLYGGDTVKFAGDALLCVFEENKGGKLSEDALELYNEIYGDFKYSEGEEGEKVMNEHKRECLLKVL